MNLVFMNSMELKTEEQRVKTAQVSICENEGKWFVIWNEPQDSGQVRQTVWFEGSRWDEMLAVFRANVKEKMGLGFTPLIDAMTDPVIVMSSRMRLAQLMACWSERHANGEVFEKLRKWRNDTAAKEGKTRYLLANNRELRMLAAFLPRTVEELTQIPGFGAKKAESYGPGIFAVTASESRERGFPLGWLEEEIAEADFVSWLRTEQDLRLKQREGRQALKAELLQGMMNGETAASLSERLNILKRDVFVWAEQLEEEGYQVDRFIGVELASMPEDKQQLAMAAFASLGDRYLKPIFQQLYGEDAAKGKEQEQAYEWLRLLRMRFRAEKRAPASQAG